MIDSNNPDPSAIALPTGGYLAVATSNLATDGATEPAFPIYFSPDLVDWELQAGCSTLIGRGLTRLCSDWLDEMLYYAIKTHPKPLV